MYDIEFLLKKAQKMKKNLSIQILRLMVSHQQFIKIITRTIHFSFHDLNSGALNLW